MSIYTGGLYFNDGRADYTNIIQWYAISGYLFFVSMDLFMQAMMPVTITFPQERLVFLKEENSKMYTLTEYFLSRNIIEIPYIMLIPFIFLLINYWMIGLGNTV
jgi:ABC-type multidrug transport system permease subunit